MAFYASSRKGITTPSEGLLGKDWILKTLTKQELIYGWIFFPVWWHYRRWWRLRRQNLLKGISLRTWPGKRGLAPFSVFFASCVSVSCPPGCDSWCPPSHILPRIMLMGLEATVAVKLWAEMNPLPLNCFLRSDWCTRLQSKGHYDFPFPKDPV